MPTCESGQISKSLVEDKTDVHVRQRGVVSPRLLRWRRRWFNSKQKHCRRWTLRATRRKEGVISSE
jgi:hypothetical protein